MNDTDAEIIRRHKAGEGRGRISKALGIHDEAVRSVLLKNGLAKRNPSNHVSADKFAKARALMAGGMGLQEAADSLGLKNKDNLCPSRNAHLEPVKQSYPMVRAHRETIRSLWKPGRYALAGDFHHPFHSQPALDQLIALKGNFDGCIVAGDLLDCYGKSSFLKDIKITMKQEVDQANSTLDRLAKRFGRVLFFKGNHEERVWKLIRKAAEAMILKGGEFGDDIAPDVYRAAKRMLALHNSELNCTVHDDWWVQIGNCIFTHGDAYVATQGKTSQNILEHLEGRAQDYGLTQPPSLVTQAHTHRMAGPMRKGRTWCWEMPAMCGPLDYQMGSKAHRGHTDTGFAVVTMHKDGSFNFNESRAYLVE